MSKPSNIQRTSGVSVTDRTNAPSSLQRVSAGSTESARRDFSKRNYAEFFGRIRALVSEDGVALIHTIGYSDAPAPINPFIRSFIFPGADRTSCPRCGDPAPALYGDAALLA